MLPKKIICAFYASSKYGSEYRAGLEFIKFAAEHGFDTAIISDLIENDRPADLEKLAPGIRVVQVPSPIKNQKMLYKYTDWLPQIIWHFRVIKHLSKFRLTNEVVWVQNGAMPWLPLVPYINVSKKIVWGPIGGGDAPEWTELTAMPWKVAVRELLRKYIEIAFLRKKVNSIIGNTHKILCLARTKESQSQLSMLLKCHVPITPEILNPVNENVFHKSSVKSPRFIWVGQDSPRKNLQYALNLFFQLKKLEFSDATLDIYGCTRDEEYDGVKFHGWVQKIDWKSYCNDGVLLLTSFREGLPSVILEAISNGIFCAATNVGSIAELNVKPLYLLPKNEVLMRPQNETIKLAKAINEHLAATEVKINKCSFVLDLENSLRRFEVIG